MKITDLKYAVLEGFPTIRITTDCGIDGLGQVEYFKPYLEPLFRFYKPYIIEQDPTNVQRVVSRIRRLGGFKPWGAAVSAIEIALWDIAGKAAGIPIYKLLGGKVRDRVRAYCTKYDTSEIEDISKGYKPEDFAEMAKARMKLPEGFTIMKFNVCCHCDIVDGAVYAEPPDEIPGINPSPIARGGHITGHQTEIAFKNTVAIVEAIKSAVGDKIGIAFDCGPRMSLASAMRLAKALEPYNVLWLEDMLTGDYTPYNNVESYRLLSESTITPIHTGEQVYLREGFRELLEKHSVDVIGPDPEDVGGIAELKWIAEMADLYDVLIAPHGVGNGPVGLAAVVQASSTFPNNFIAFEMPILRVPDNIHNKRENTKYKYDLHKPTKHDLFNGLDDLKVVNGFVNVPDKPGLGLTLNREAVREHLGENNNFLD